MNNKYTIDEYKKLEEKYCYKCNYFYEGFICGFEISADDDKDTIEDIKLRRKYVCKLDKYKK